LDRFHEDRLKTIKEFEGNRAVLSAVLYWADHLRSLTSLFRGAAVPITFGSLEAFKASVGIVDASWQAKNPVSGIKGDGDGPSLFAEIEGELP
jgi:hypothetical protein